jgi:hypothetical protein
MTYASNIFQISDAQAYQCKMKGYFAGHSQMYIEASLVPVETRKPLFLAFEAVLYFEGPVRWRGANFRYGTPDETAAIVALLSKAGVISSDTDYQDYLLRKHRLFLVDSIDVKVKILAGDAYRISECPQISVEAPKTPPMIFNVAPPDIPE